MVQVAEKEWIPTMGISVTPRTISFGVADPRLEQVIQQKAQDIVEESKNRIIRTANRIMGLIYEDIKHSFNKLIKEVDSVWTSARPLDFAYDVYCVTKDVKGETSLHLVKIENELRQKYSGVSIEIRETLLGNEDIIPSIYSKVYPKR